MIATIFRRRNSLRLMNMFRGNLLPVTVIAALGVTVPLTSASADPVTITDNSWYGDSSGITVNAAGASYSGYAVGPQNVTISDTSNPGLSGTVSTVWCIDFNDDISVPGTYSYELVPFSTSGLATVSTDLNSPEPAGLLSNATAISEINYLANLGNGLLAGEPGSAAYGTQDDIASAIQIAIWQELYPTTISYTGESQTVLNDIDSFLVDASKNSDYQTVGYALISTSGGPQQLAYGTDPVPPPSVPEPGTLVLLSSALIGFGAIRRKSAAA
jgi:hypothetical protein